MYDPVPLEIYTAREKIIFFWHIMIAEKSNLTQEKNSLEDTKHCKFTLFYSSLENFLKILLYVTCPIQKKKSFFFPGVN